MFHVIGTDRVYVHGSRRRGQLRSAPLRAWTRSQPDVRVMVIEPGAVATELTDHITNPGVKQVAEQMYRQLAITADDIAEVIAFAVSRPRRMTINEILVRPTAQP